MLLFRIRVFASCFYVYGNEAERKNNDGDDRIAKAYNARTQVEALTLDWSVGEFIFRKRRGGKPQVRVGGLMWWWWRLLEAFISAYISIIGNKAMS